MRVLLDASLQLRLIRHEIDAAGREKDNAAFPNWPSIRTEILKMESYFGTPQADFRNNSKKISELQLAAEKDLSRQGEVWETIKNQASIADMLAQPGAQSQEVAQPGAQSQEVAQPGAQ